MAERNKPLPIVVLISGNGSNLQAIIDAIAAAKINVEIRAVISNRADAYGLERARNNAIPAEVLDHTAFNDRADYDRALRELIDSYAPELVVLAGFMRILTPEFVEHYRGRMLNIHPSLLPRHRGLNTHRRVLQAGDTRHGVTVHFVTPDLDSGPIIAQSSFPVRGGDDAASLEQRVHRQEHILYPMVLGWFAEGRVRLDGQCVLVDGGPAAETTPVLDEE